MVFREDLLKTRILSEERRLQSAELSRFAVLPDKSGVPFPLER
jgi:hypothetical protein